MSETTDPSEEKEQPETITVTPKEAATPAPPTVPSEEKLSDRDKRRKGFWNGFWICLGLNILFGCVSIIMAIDVMERGGSGLGMLSIIWLATNLLLMILLAANRRRMAEGFIVGFAIAFALSLLAGVFMMASCFGVI